MKRSPRSRDMFRSGLLLLCAALVRCTLGPGLSTPDQRARVISLTRLLEQDPLAGNAPETRQWLREWIVEVPDIKVFVCDDLLGHGLGANYPYTHEITFQTMSAAAAFAIEHPDKARDDTAQYHAGVEGALRAYEALRRSRPDAKSAFLDDLLAKRDRGQLADHVAKLAADQCKRSNTILIAHLGGAGVGLVLGLLVAWWFGERRSRRNDGSTRIAKPLQWVVFVCAAYFVSAVTVLHLLEPERDPRYWFMSGYALGRYGWLMTTTFFALGLAAFVVAAAIRDQHPAPRAVRLGFGLLAVGALFVCLAGVFKDSLPHLLASVVAFPSITMAVLLVSWSFRQAAARWSMPAVTLWIALGMLAAFLSMAADVGLPGLQQRAFILLFLLWLSIVMHRLVEARTVAT